MHAQPAAPTKSNAPEVFRSASIARRPAKSAYTFCLARTVSRSRYTLLSGRRSSVPDKASVTERCIQMAGLLRKLRGFADEEDSACIGELLEAVSIRLVDILSTGGVSVLLVLGINLAEWRLGFVLS